MSDPIVIVSAARTPLAAFQGEFSTLSANELGAVAIGAALERAGLKPDQVDAVLMGNVLQAGQGQAPARQASIKAGIPSSVGAITVSKVCGSGMQAAMLAHDGIIADTYGVVVAGGMESMTNAPYLLTKARGGYRAGHATMYDHMMLDGLEDAYQVGRAMGTFGEDCAAKYGFTREEQDTFAVESVSRAQKAARDGVLKWETVPVTIKSKKGDTVIELDERPQKLNVEKIPTLKPAFAANGTITAASSSGNADGAAALVLMRESTASKLGCKPIARIVGHASFAQEPEWFTTAPVGAIKKLYDKTGWKTADVDLFEINEAFAAVTMAAMKEHDIPRDKVNIHGGACAVGHPIGASGARIMVSLLGALKATQGKRGVATLCIGGGEATAIALEMV
ncbi:acetyl-CoA C-acyltransferase [Achromobacter xylosoxidans]|jgi:acetyl-CoA C-acetyltransferase|uniref:Acetyl-CoA C-acyltransferase n=2 Tax=Alcaligenes xylosoxydans xylosoxydans TaxID=85698 RepID=A0A0D6I5X5_ALCXX|nr:MULTISPECIES: acetyl-CoA C-acyltransferase [Achromobacter]AHC48550.1 Acetyl-CoA C-acyltransferase [Achromobacter xylosoxidans NBRC 15126 = ATCC 27061]AMH04426.1 acetyl-CoA C-acyltransferase [Achromobacter xylosoxidans]AXA78747.1 acetyl-CoA acetyltransferase [Achromobacter xylosoxidans]KAA5925934.1 acetyl-CoA C-acyltransferase [Achromobacter xylosoxidans]KMJ92122.1 acetyl-CoA acetyltransferase [Achromobacter xylosoxidans]